MKALILAILIAPFAFSLAVRYDQISSTTNSACAPGVLCNLLVIPGTIVNVCTGLQTTLVACKNNLATTYTGSSASTPCASSSQLTPQTGGACVSTSDNQGGYGFWIIPGQYSYWLTIPASAGGGSYGPYPISTGASSSSCPPIVTCDINFQTFSAAVAAAGSGILYVTEAWSISGVTLNSGMSLQLANTAILKAGADNSTMLTEASGVSITCLQGGGFDGQYSQHGFTNVIAVSATGTSNIFVTGCTFNNFANSSIARS